MHRIFLITIVITGLAVLVLNIVPGRFYVDCYTSAIQHGCEPVYVMKPVCEERSTLINIIETISNGLSLLEINAC